MDGVAGALETLLAKGATGYDPLTPRGEGGWVTASVLDPFRNILGIMYNPHYVEILQAMGTV